ncbi:probable G-protein coupled receptor [Denticeps clupeoides]|uniref:G-protein coupled receptors family 1 profile domain-containing protein n=1 Tax=Denticeps clupeoides TaxID=299321 RepID=A0AAY4E483_9TELE|nr:probable G-protein coupled receptor [Denticeps clupeoides]
MEDFASSTLAPDLNHTMPNISLTHDASLQLIPSMHLGTAVAPQSRLKDLAGVVCMVTVNAVALLANTAVLVVVVRAPHLRRLVFVGHLCAVDLLCATLLMPLGVLSSSPLFSSVLFSSLECRLYAFLHGALVPASIFTITAISIECYYYIVHPMRYEAKMTTRMATTTLLLVWLVSVLLGLATMLGWPPHVRRGSVSASLCPLHWRHSRHRSAFTLLFTSICFCLPAAVILAVYGNVYKVARVAARHQNGPLPSWSSTRTTVTRPLRSDSVNSQITIITTMTCARSRWRHGGASRRKRHLGGGKAAVTLAVIVGQFLLCWMPYFAFHLHLSLGSSHSMVDEAVGPVTWLAYSSFAINPFFYGLLNRQIREELCKLLCCCRWQCSTAWPVRPEAANHDGMAPEEFLQILQRNSDVGRTPCSCNTSASKSVLDQTSLRIPGLIPEELP